MAGVCQAPLSHVTEGTMRLERVRVMQSLWKAGGLTSVQL